MKIKHYRAPDMRQALRQVREAQGPDAVILSSQRIAGGVEVVAAVDYDVAQSPAESYGENYGADAGYARAMGYGHSSVSPAMADVERSASTPQSAHLGYGRDVASAAAAELHEGDAFYASHAPVQTPGTAQSVSAAMSEELRTLRQMLETQLATLAWNDLSRRAPLQTELLKQLTELGIANALAGELVAQLPSKLELAEAQRLALALLSRRIAVTEERWIEKGGRVAMVGPTGVGKTTLIAKLAARWVMRHGPRSLALISADCVRIGAQEQIHTLGRLLGAPAYAIEGVHELPDLLEHLADRRLILIDTAGLSQRDARLAGELEVLAGADPKLEISLVLSAAAQAGALEEALERFAPARAACCVLTKLDEATSLGGAISMLIRSGMPLAYCCDGQRVPEDLAPARAHQLIARAVELSRRAGATADEDLLQRRFGAVAHALA